MISSACAVFCCPPCALPAHGSRKQPCAGARRSRAPCVALGLACGYGRALPSLRLHPVLSTKPACNLEQRTRSLLYGATPAGPTTRAGTVQGLAGTAWLVVTRALRRAQVTSQRGVMAVGDEVEITRERLAVELTV